MPNFLTAALCFCCACAALRCPLAVVTASRVFPGPKNADPWRSFGRLLDAERGNSVRGLAGLKRYFIRFGYLSGPAEETTPTDAFDDEFESAVQFYQTRLGLPATGRLDSTTLAQIMSPRCGVRDTVELDGAGTTNGSDAAQVSRFAFFQGEPRWARATRPLVLTYAISRTATVGYLPQPVVSSAFRRAFDRWAQVIPVQFLEVSDYLSSDVHVGFYDYDHGDGEPFDGPLGILAHAFSPENGRLHLDAAERWAVDFDAEKSKRAIDLESVATHEIGHVLGLAHSPVPSAVMYPSLKPRSRKVQLSADDVEGVQELYGSNPQFQLSSLAASSDTSAAGGGSSGSVGVGLMAVAVVTWVLLVSAKS